MNAWNDGESSSLHASYHIILDREAVNKFPHVEGASNIIVLCQTVAEAMHRRGINYLLVDLGSNRKWKDIHFELRAKLSAFFESPADNWQNLFIESIEESYLIATEIRSALPDVLGKKVSVFAGQRGGGRTVVVQRALHALGCTVSIL